MSEKHNTEDFDLMMKSILDEAREEVPAHVWEGVSAGLDKAARRRTVVLWFRRSAVAVAAAAAVVFGVFFTYNTDNEFVPAAQDTDVIAVVEPEAVVSDDAAETMTESEIPDMVAKADIIPYSTKREVPAADVIHEIPAAEDEADEAVENENTSSPGEGRMKVEDEKPAVEDENESSVKAAEPKEYFPTVWEEDEVRTKRDVSFVLSGIAGTNNALSQDRVGPMMAPTVSPVPKETGIEETSTKSSYGIPLSFGAGVKFDLSKRWSIGAGLNYTFLSRQFYGKYTKVGPTGDIESVTSSDIRNQQHYLGIPVNVFYDIINNDKVNFYAYAGGTAEKCLSDSYSLLNTSIHHKEKVAGVQLSANAGIGVEFMLGRHLGLYLDPSVRYYFKNEKQPKNIRTVQPLMLGFEMGLRVRL